MPESQLDLICTECPLKSCDENSLWCVLRLVTKPNDAQLALIAEGKDKIGRTLRQSVKRYRRRQYFRERYQANRDKYLAAANERHERLRQAKCSGR